MRGIAPISIVIADSSIVQSTDECYHQLNENIFSRRNIRCESSCPNLVHPCVTGSHRRPTIVPSNLVPPKLLLSISVPNVRVNIVVVKDPAFNRIVINTLSARRVNIAMRLKNNVSTASQTRCASSIDLQTIISTYPTASDTTKGRLTNPPVAEDDLQTLILYSAPGAGRSVSR